MAKGAPISDVREISNLAYGFIGSKVLFSALNARIFELLAKGARSLADLEREAGIAGNRLDTLLTACTSLGLIERGADGYRNAPASQQYLVADSPLYFADYFRFQIDRQIYPLLANLDEALRGRAPASLYGLMANAEEADYFTRAQHAGSLGPAAVVAKQVHLAGAARLLDVAGAAAPSVSRFAAACRSSAPPCWISPLSRRWPSATSPKRGWRTASRCCRAMRSGPRGPRSKTRSCCPIS